jgi:hypothetical protein
MKKDFQVTKHLSFHFTIQLPIWEFHVLPFFDISEWRILAGWLCFSIQYTYNPDIFDDYDN